MTAVGYYFGKKLREGLGIPVGIIHSSWEARKSQRGSPGRSLMPTASAPCAAITGWTPPYLRLGEGTGQENISPRLNQGSPDHPYKPADFARIRHRMDNGPPHHGRHLVSGRIRCGRSLTMPKTACC